MIRLSDIDPSSDLIVEMLSERTGTWTITDDRVTLLRENRNRVSDRNRSALDEMLSISNSGERLWPCKSEFFSVLHEIQSIQTKPTTANVSQALRALEEGAKKDHVDHREWVQETAGMLRRIISYGVS